MVLSKSIYLNNQKWQNRVPLQLCSWSKGRIIKGMKTRMETKKMRMVTRANQICKRRKVSAQALLQPRCRIRFLQLQVEVKALICKQNGKVVTLKQRGIKSLLDILITELLKKMKSQKRLQNSSRLNGQRQQMSQIRYSIMDSRQELRELQERDSKTMQTQKYQRIFGLYKKTQYCSTNKRNLEINGLKLLSFYQEELKTKQEIDEIALQIELARATKKQLVKTKQLRSQLRTLPLKFQMRKYIIKEEDKKQINYNRSFLQLLKSVWFNNNPSNERKKDDKKKGIDQKPFLTKSQSSISTQPIQ